MKMAADRDIVTSILSGVAAAAMAPFNAAIELVTDGEVSSDTSDALISSVIDGGISGRDD
jgi:dihydrodipicolinate synthase/N-acetylneuraminate lyase